MPSRPLTGGGSNDAFITKLSAAGDSLVYSTFLGDEGADFGRAIAVDAAGNAYVTGYTDSDDFPAVNPFQPAYAGNTDAFVAKFNVSGSALAYSTYLGGSGFERGRGIAVDEVGNAYVTGTHRVAGHPHGEWLPGRFRRRLRRCLRNQTESVGLPPQRRCGIFFRST